MLEANLANSYAKLGRDDEALRLRRDVYSRHLKLDGKEHVQTIQAAHNYASSLLGLKRFEEAKALLRIMIRVARRVLGESRTLTLVMRWHYAMVLYEDPAATLEDLREAVTTLEDDERIARRVFGGAHPVAVAIEHGLENARAALRAREPPPPGRA